MMIVNVSLQADSFRREVRLALRSALIATCCVLIVGCKSQPQAPPRPLTARTLQLRQQVGGTHYRTLVQQGVWYQTFGSSLLVIDPKTAAPTKRVELGKPGETGPAIDLIAAGSDRLFAIVEDDELVELSIAEPRNPAIVRNIPAESLGIKPHTLSEVDGEIYVSGRGGVVRVSDRQRIYSTDEIAGRVARGESGLVVCVGRRVFRISDGQFVGSATDLARIPAGMTRAGDLIFTRQNDTGALVGLMTPAIREVDVKTGTIGSAGFVRNVRFVAGRVWVVTDEWISGYEIHDTSLEFAQRIDILGARDLSLLADDQLAIAGTFGRAIFRLRGNSGEFTTVQREPGRLDGATTDGRHILAASAEGSWMYLINARAELTARPLRNPFPLTTHASAVDSQAKITEDGAAVLVTRPGSAVERYSEPGGALIRCVAAVDGDFWIGHDRGITVLRGKLLHVSGGTSPRDKNAAPVDTVAGSVRLAGPVIYIFPLLVGGGASYVSEFGGFGVVQFVEEPSPLGQPMNR